MGEKLSIQAKHDLQAAIAALNQLAKSIGTVSDEEKKNAGAAGTAGRETEKLSQAQKKASTSSSELSGALGGLKSALVALGLGQFVKDSTDLFVQQQQAINIIAASTGDIESATEEYERWRRVTETLGIEFNRSSIIYARFLTTAKQAGIPIENARAAADGLAIAQRAMNLTSYEAELAFRALGQIANKSVVNMEELRQQLGERVAGVMDALSKRLGITTKELFKMTETGEFTADVFFQKFGPAMAEAFKDQAITNADSLAANLERIGNAGRRIQIEFSAGFADELNRAMKETKESTKGAEDGFHSLGRGIGVLVGWIGDLFGQFHRIRSFFADVQALLFDLAAGFGDFQASIIEKLAGLFSAMRSAAEGLNLDKMASNFGKVESALNTAAAGFREGAKETKALADASREVSNEQIKAQVAIEEGGKAANSAAEEINALASGAKTTEQAFNKLDPEIAKFTDRINDLGEKTDIAVEALRRMMEKGPLSEAQLAVARTEVEKLVKAWDFKHIPPELEALAKQLGVATTETKKNTKEVQAQKKAYDELLKSLKAVKDELQKSADEAQKAAEENAKRIAELDQTFLNPEDFNELFDRRAKQVQLDRDAREAKEKLLYAQEDLNAAELAAAAASGEFSSGVTGAKAALDAFSGSADVAITKLGGLSDGFSGVGSLAALLGGKMGIGPAGTFGLGQPAAPGGSVSAGAGLPSVPGNIPILGGGQQAPSLGVSVASQLSLLDAGVGNVKLRDDLKRSQGLSTDSSGIIAGIIAEQILAGLGKSENWETAFQQEAINKLATAATTGVIGTGKDGGVKPGEVRTDFGAPSGTFDPATGKVTDTTRKEITNLSEEGEDLNAILGDVGKTGGESMEAIQEGAKGATAELVGFAAEADNLNNAIPILADEITVAANAASDLPTGVKEAADALSGASQAGEDYTDAIMRADGQTGKLGFTANAVAGSIAAAAGAATDFGSEIADESQIASVAMEKIGDSAGRTLDDVRALREELAAINEILVGGGNQPISLDDLLRVPH